jgi:hypothetical protein
MTWISNKPIQSGWYFYRARGKNADQPLSAWVFTDGPFVFVCMFAPHADIPRQESGQTKDFQGEWWGPVKVPE